MDPQKNYFSSLNDYCTFKLLEYLPLDDLSAISQSCKNLQRIAGLVFRYQYQHLTHKPLTILCESGTVRFRHTDEHIKCFSRQFENVEIHFSDFQMCTILLLIFMKINCSENIKIISFHGSQCSAFQRDIMYICDMIQNVEKFSFNLRIRVPISLNDIVNSLKSIRHLSVCSIRETNLQHVKCDNLKKFECQLSYQMTDKDFELLEIFLLNNPSVQTFVCNMILPIAENLKSLIQLVRRTKIKELFIDIASNTEINFSHIRDELQLLDRGKHFRRLVLSLNSSVIANLSELSLLKSFTDFHLRHYNSLFNLEEAITTMNEFKNLKVLHIDGYLHDFLAEKLSENFSINLFNLETLYFQGLSYSKHLIQPFIINSTKVSQIYVLDKCCTLALDLPDLDMKRQKLKNASKLNIFVNNNEPIVKNLRVIFVKKFSAQMLHLENTFILPDTY